MKQYYIAKKFDTSYISGGRLLPSSKQDNYACGKRFTLKQGKIMFYYMAVNNNLHFNVHLMVKMKVYTNG